MLIFLLCLVGVIGGAIGWLIGGYDGLLALSTVSIALFSLITFKRLQDMEEWQKGFGAFLVGALGVVDFIHSHNALSFLMTILLLLCTLFFIISLFVKSSAGHRSTVEGHLRTLASKPHTEIVMGDVFQNISHSTIVSRSQVEKAFNRLKDSGQNDAAQLITRIGERVSKANNPAAGTLYRQMVDEVIKPECNKDHVKSYWNGLVAILPALANLSTEVLKSFGPNN